MQRLPRDLPAPTTATAVITRLLTTAASQIGYREGRSSSGSWNNDNAFGKWYGTNGVAWCAQFVSWAAAAADIPETVIPKHQYTPTGWNWFTARDRDVTTPRAGDIFYVYGYVSSEGRSRVHHVGIVEKVLSGGRIQTIEGNTNTSGSAQGNGVYRLIRPISTTKLRFARPNYAAAVQAPPPVKPPATKPPTQGDDDMAISDAQMTELKNHITKEVRRFSIWELRWLTQTEDERQEARAKFDAAIASGKTPEEAAALVVAELAPLDADLSETQKKG